MNNCRCSGTAGCQCPLPDDLERRTREGRLTFTEAVAKLQGRHCEFVERHGLKLRLSETIHDVLVTETHRSPDLRVADYLADNWHIVRA
jgi:hypothetical protein